MYNFSHECLKTPNIAMKLSTKTKPEAGKPKNGQFEDTNHQKVHKEKGICTSLK